MYKKAENGSKKSAKTERKRARNSSNCPKGTHLQATGGPNGKAPTTADDDPAFQAVIKRVKDVSAKQQKHAPAKAKANESQAAAESPASELAGKAQANQVDTMESAEAPPFDAAAFKAQLMERIAALAPKTVQEADNFKGNNKLGGVKSEMQGKVKEEKESSQSPLAETTAAPPDVSAVEPKPVTPLAPEEAGPAPADVGATGAVPKAKGTSEVEAPLQENSQKLNAEMGEVEEADLEKSNEPEFLGALASKREAQTHAQNAPQEYRQAEGEQLSAAEGEAVATAQDRTQAMHGDRAGLLGQVAEQQGQTKSADEQARDKVAADIQKIYDETKTNVEKILSELDGKVETAFDEGAAAAKQVFEDFVKAKMDAYKERRYGGWLGWAKWAKDKLLGMPSEVNAFYTDGRSLYLRKMDAVIDNVVAIVGTGITEAKAEVARGKERIQEYVAKLPEDLQSVGQQAASDIQDKFDDLENSINDKQNELADSLATKYQENLQAIDARIEEMKAANQGLVDKALNAVVGVVKAILKLKDLLLGVLAKIAGVVTKIIKAPIEFLGNLVKGVKQGFSDFLSRIGTHLQTALIAWLTGALGPMNIQIPDDLFSLPGIFSLVMQVLGLTWEYIRGKAVKLLGEPVVKALESGFEIFQILIRDGVAGLWEFVKEQFTNLKEMVIDQIKDMVITEVIKAGVKWVLGLLNPAGAFIKAAMAIYEIVKFFIERGSQIIEMVNAFIDAVAAIASGAVGGAAKLVENALAKALPVVIGFLASLLGISGLAKKVQKLIMRVRKKIDKAIDKVILKAKKAARKLGGGKPSKAGISDEAAHRKIAQSALKKVDITDKGDTPSEKIANKQKVAAREVRKGQGKLGKGLKFTIVLTNEAKYKEDKRLKWKAKISPNDAETSLEEPVDKTPDGKTPATAYWIKWHKPATSKTQAIKVKLDPDKEHESVKPTDRKQVTVHLPPAELAQGASAASAKLAYVRSKFDKLLQKFPGIETSEGREGLKMQLMKQLEADRAEIVALETEVDKLKGKRGVGLVRRSLKQIQGRVKKLEAALLAVEQYPQTKAGFDRDIVDAQQAVNAAEQAVSEALNAGEGEKRTETIGISSGNQIEEGTVVGPRRKSPARKMEHEFKKFMRLAGHDLTELQEAPDHVKELSLNGPDQFDNLWPIPGSDNTIPTQVIDQDSGKEVNVGFSDAGKTGITINNLQRFKDKYFVIKGFKK